jgi:hypothetical protein
MLLGRVSVVNLADGTRTRALCPLSAAGFAGVTAADGQWEFDSVFDQLSQLLAQRHRLPEVRQEGVRVAPPVMHLGNYHHR